jgi:Rps23 Pro-64 3,4-dihydroxylase Tpa1-like proline 4-hydroxylase
LIDAAGWPVGELARAWREARPFPFVAVDGLLGLGGLARVRDDFRREPLGMRTDEHYLFFSSAEPPSQPALREVIDALAARPVLEAVEQISGKKLAGVTGQAFFYQPGHYLLPHSDMRAALRRAVAFAYYVAADGLRGGELELFDCRMEAGDVAATQSDRVLPPREDRLMLFDVSERSLHQVREVIAGVRASIAGWFLS